MTRSGLIRGSRRPVPDEAPLEDEPAPQPERREPKLSDPRLRDLSLRDWRAIVTRAGKAFLNDNCMMLASALAYSTFFAIPAVLLVAVGVFTLVASPATILTLIDHLGGVIPPSAQKLLASSLLYLGPDVDLPKWEFLTPGSVVAVVLWLAASAGFAVYTATFASYNKTWGSLAAVIVMLTWLWITGMALLLGAEINAEAERSRTLRGQTV
jgi:membrane protein